MDDFGFDHRGVELGDVGEGYYFGGGDEGHKVVRNYVMKCVMKDVRKIEKVIMIQMFRVSEDG